MAGFGPSDTVTATIPSAAPATGGIRSAADALGDIFKENAASLEAARKEAMIPIKGGVPQSLPLSLAPKNNQAPYAQPDMRQAPVGKGNARGIGIANSVTGMLNTVAAFRTNQENQKSVKIADATQKMLTLQNATEQAMQVKPSDGAEAYAAAQQVILKNKLQMNHILSDKTIEKGISKGMQIDFTDPKSNQTPEHKGVQQGKAAAQKSLADKFMEAQPQALQQDPRAVAKYEAIQAQQKGNLEILKAILPAQIRADSAEHVEQVKSATEILKAQNASNDAWNRIHAAQEFRMRVLNKEQQNSISRIWTEVAADKQKEMQRIQLVNSDPSKIVPAAQQSAASDVHLIATVENQIATYQSQLLANPKAPDDVKQQLKDAIQQHQERLDILKGDQKLHFQYWNGIKLKNGIKPDSLGGEADASPRAGVNPSVGSGEDAVAVANAEAGISDEYLNY